MASITLPVEAQPLHSVSATETAGPIIKLPGASTGQTFYAGYSCIVQYQSALLASGSGTLQFQTQLSFNKGTTWVNGQAGAAITLSTTSQAGEQVIPIQATTATDCGEVWLQVLAQYGGSPVGQTCVYRADLR